MIKPRNTEVLVGVGVAFYLGILAAAYFLDGLNLQLCAGFEAADLLALLVGMRLRSAERVLLYIHISTHIAAALILLALWSISWDAYAALLLLYVGVPFAGWAAGYGLIQAGRQQEQDLFLYI